MHRETQVTNAYCASYELTSMLFLLTNLNDKNGFNVVVVVVVVARVIPDRNCSHSATWCARASVPNLDKVSRVLTVQLQRAAQRS